MPIKTEDQNTTSNVLKLRGVTKRFGSLIANDGIDLEIKPGKIHCLLGENGAGKSTLMNQLYGLLQPDQGTISIGDEEQHFKNPQDAIKAGIGMVHQHFMLVEVFTVAENISLGREPGALGVFNMRQAKKKVRELSDKYNMAVEPGAVIENLPVGVQQRVEILKALANNAEYLIFDEPTAVLTPQEIDELMQVMRALKDEGKAIVFITHKLGEVREVADEITVIRRGKVVGKAEPTMSESKLAEMMVGRTVNLKVDKKEPELGDVRLKIQGISVVNESGVVVVDDLDLDIRAGEILCIAGVQGNGQTELAKALLGTMPISKGQVFLDSNDITNFTPKQTIDAGVGYIPEDRQKFGFVGDFTIAENLILNRISDYSRFGNLKLTEIKKNAEKSVATFDIRSSSIYDKASSLSGGNQQKMILSREFSRELSLLIGNQPTRGVDVGAIEFLHKRIVSERDRGAAVMLVSTELEEVQALADRIAVMFKGRIVGIVPPDTPFKILGLMMAGITYEDAKKAVMEAKHD